MARRKLISTPTTSVAEAPPNQVPTAPESKETELQPVAPAFLENVQFGDFPEDMRLAVKSLLKKISPEKRGIHISGASPVFRPSIIKIFQPMTKVAPPNSKPGDMVTTMNTNLGREFSFIPLAVWNERIKWPEGQSTSMQAQCKSLDATNGWWERAKWLDCATCKYSSWDPTYKGKGGYPCTLTTNIAGIDEKLTQFYRIQFQKTTATVGKKFRNILTNSDEIFDSIYTISTQQSDRSANWEYSLPKVARKLDQKEPLYRLSEALTDALSSLFLTRATNYKMYLEAADEELGFNSGESTEGSTVTIKNSNAAPAMNM